MRWVIGDVHGMLTPLRALADLVRADDPEAEFLFVGDYVNRGPDSKGVIDFLLGLQHARFVRGNHDDVFDQVINGRSYTGKQSEEDRTGAFQWFMQYGLDQTLMSYGAEAGRLMEIAARPTGKALRQLADLVPDEHKRFIRYLPATIEDKDIFVAHARWEPDESTDPSIFLRLQKSEALRQKIIWGRFTAEEVAMPKVWMRVGYFGHTPVLNYLYDDPDAVSVPVLGPQIVLLDTAAALGPEGRLTAFCVERQTYLQVDRAGKPLESPRPHDEH